MGAAPSSKTILFVDLTDSTGLYERLGDEKALRYSSHAIACWQRIVDAVSGRVVKRIGDELLCVFPNAENAAQAALDIQCALDSGLPSVEMELHARIGFHAGPFLEENGDVFGDTVNLAARVVSLAQPGQILTTSDTVKELPPFFAMRSQTLGSTAVKGKSGSIGICELVWKAAIQTQFTPITNPVAAEKSMLIRRGEDRFVIDCERPALRLGRFDHNDLVLESNVVSRSHCRIEYRRGRFVLIDESCNGTWLHPPNGEPRRVHQNELTLPRIGYLGLGERVDEQHPHCVHFTVEARKAASA
jgi:class 3 adenylate cyclase